MGSTRFLAPYKTPRAFVVETRGTAIVQFALIAMPFFALIVAVFQITTTFLAQQALETASEKAVRQLMTGAAQQAGTNQAQFKALVCSKLPGFMKCANIYVDVQTATSFATANTSPVSITLDSSGRPADNFIYAPAPAGQITIARIMYVWSVQNGPLGFSLATLGNGRRLLTATSVFKTEPYT